MMPLKRNIVLQSMLLTAAFTATQAGAADPSTAWELKTNHDVVAQQVQDLHMQSFSQFKATVNARAAEVTLDQNADQFERTWGELQEYYASLPVVETVKVRMEPIGSNPNAQLVAFDCVPRGSQPALKDTAHSMELPPADPEIGQNRTKQSRSVAAPKAVDDPKTIVFRNNPACPLGSVPLARVTPSEKLAASLHQVPTLDRKLFDRINNVEQEGIAQPENPMFKHRYAHAATVVGNNGAGARLNVWSPTIQPSDMSLSQIWVVGSVPGGTQLQTVEVGWQVMSLWQSPFSTLFAYATADGYVRTGCYATRCAATGPQTTESFVLVTNKVVIGKPIEAQSQPGGPQDVIDVKWLRNPDTGSWWLMIDGEWIGYYPATFFAPGPMASAATYVDFGGETAEVGQSVPISQMGSGHHASEGLGHAAFQSRLRYFDLAGGVTPPTLVPEATDPDCYSILVNAPVPPETEAGEYIYFGGPGASNAATCAEH